MGRLYIAIAGLIVVGIILVVQLAQGETGWLHWVGLAAVVIGLASIGVEMQKKRQE
jgi:membrane protein implicated in regulation of membrane protease activity